MIPLSGPVVFKNCMKLHNKLSKLPSNNSYIIRFAMTISVCVYK